MIIQTKRTEEDMIWTTIDSIAIEECLDSVSMITMKAYKYMSHMDELSKEEKDDIVYYAKKCAPEYGYGVNLMRSIASLFDETDFRQYDEDCNNSNNGEEEYKNFGIDQRSVDNEIVIIPNPNTGRFIISNLNIEEVASTTLYDIQGIQLLENISILSNEINISEKIDSGLYLLSIKYNNGELVNKKIIVVK